MNRLVLIIIVIGSFFSCKKTNTTTHETTDVPVKINIAHNVGNAVFNTTSNFVNSHGEQFRIDKFNYYISNVQLITTSDNTIEKENESYHLIQAETPSSNSFNFNVKKKTANKIKFLVGVDSTRNVSGAQTGALDPLNGMFWTWHSGYIMAKLEGNSPQSNAVNNLITYHIGGFSGVNSTLRWVTLDLPQAAITNSGITINLKCNINKFFDGVHVSKIVDEPIMMDHGAKAAKFADNYATMFSIQ